jgi:acetyl-CoA carboxylase carboxyltransferase component
MEEKMKELGAYWDKIEKQHSKGKLFVYERLNLIYDNGEYKELIPENEQDGVVVCEGKISGKSVIVAAQDFTYKGGSLGLRHGRNIAYAIDTALKKKCPFISINDSGGARIQEGIDSLAGFGDIFYRNVKASGIIPQISMISGPCAGGAVYSPAIMDFIFMVDGTGQMYITGPKVIEAVTWEKISAEELGGHEMHLSKSGVCQFGYATELDCIQAIRNLISILPKNNKEKIHIPPKDIYKKMPSKQFEMPVSKRKPYDVREIIRFIFDDDSFMEVSSSWGEGIVVGFAKLYGITIGVVGNQPNYIAGVLDCDTSDKAARFVRFCDAFGIPLISYTDVPGYMPGIVQEKKGIIRHGAKLLYAFAEATVPKINVIVRKAYGGAYIAMNSKHLGADYVYAWRTAEVAVLGASGAVEVLYAKDIKEKCGEDKDIFIKEKKKEYESEVINYKKGLEQGYIDELIEIEDTREILYNAITKLIRCKRVKKFHKNKHGNIPL